MKKLLRYLYTHRHPILFTILMSIGLLILGALFAAVESIVGIHPIYE